jgi:glycerophosphoryl diester phosphodiesterase
LLAEARKHDLQVVCWTVNHPAHMRMLMAAGVAGIMSDYPERVVAAVKKEALSSAEPAEDEAAKFPSID